MADPLVEAQVAAAASGDWEAYAAALRASAAQGSGWQVDLPPPAPSFPAPFVDERRSSIWRIVGIAAAGVGVYFVLKNRGS